MPLPIQAVNKIILTYHCHLYFTLTGKHAMTLRRVLIIEDDADAAGVLDAYLRRENYAVAISGDGRAGLPVFRRKVPPAYVD